MVLVVILNSIINITIMKNKTLATAAMAACATDQGGFSDPSRT